MSCIPQEARGNGGVLRSQQAAGAEQACSPQARSKTSPSQALTNY